MDIDYAIRAAPGKGLGMFALQSFERNETVVAERAMLMLPPGALHMPLPPLLFLCIVLARLQCSMHASMALQSWLTHGALPKFGAE
jgi:hypothetical protein